MLKPGRDNFSVSFYHPIKRPFGSNQGYSAEFRSDLKACITHLKNKYGKPENQRSAQKQIVDCMKRKEWSFLEEILMKH